MIYIKTMIFGFLLPMILLIPGPSYTDSNTAESLCSKNKFFVKMKQPLGVSEATAEISLTTGIYSIDEKNKRFGITKIKRVFEVNNGDPALYQNLEMDRIYIFYANKDIDDIISAVDNYSMDENVGYSEPNFIGQAAGRKENPEDNLVPNDTYFSRQWYLKNTGTIKPSSANAPKIGADINMEKAWDLETGNEDLIIAILDSGIEDLSLDLKGRLWINKKEIPDNDIDDDNNGYVDDYKGWDFAYDDNNPGDGFGHGTNIATVIGAQTNNSFGFAGINSKSRLMNCKNLSDNNSGEYEWWAKSLKYAVDNGAKIINMSEGGEDYSKVLKTAVEYAALRGAFVAAAMMNKGNGKDYYPAAFKGIFAVGATDSDDRRCVKFSWGGGSCWGKHIAVVAPGNKIYGVDYEDPFKFDTYWSGTSQSTAIVSAIASLLLSQDRTRTPEEIKKIIIATAHDMAGDSYEDKKGWDQFYGYGRVDCYDALRYEPGMIKDAKHDKDVDNTVIEDEVNRDNSFDQPAKSVKDDTRKGAKPEVDKPAKKR